MKEFNLELAKQGKPVCVEDGREVELLKFNMRGKYPILGIIKDETEDNVMSWKTNGEFGYDEETHLDLMMASEKHERWANLFRKNGHCFLGSDLFSTREGAVDDARNDEDYVTTIKIEWEE